MYSKLVQYFASKILGYLTPSEAFALKVKALTA
jgi:hypothetical protein